MLCSRHQLLEVTTEEFLLILLVVSIIFKNSFFPKISEVGDSTRSTPALLNLLIKIVTFLY